MADVVARLKVDSKEYDSKIERARAGLLNLAQSMQGAGKTFADATKEQVAFAKGLGQMDTVAKTARGRLSELTKAYTDLRMQYKGLTDAEKQSPLGQALATSLEQLRGRIQETKKGLSDIGKELSGLEEKGGGGGLLSGLGTKMSGALAVFGGNMMTAAAGAVANLGSEMAGMVREGVELARASEGVRNAFERLGRGDLLDGLRKATHGTVTDVELMKAAVKFNDFKLPVEELGTMLAFAQQKAKDTGQSVDYMVDSIVTGLGRKSLMILDNLGLSAADIKDRMKETGDMTKAVGAIIRDQMASAGGYVETAADRTAQANVSLQNKMEELGQKFLPLQEASTQLWTSMKIGILDVVGGPLTRLLNGLTEAGRMRNALSAMNGEAGSGNTEVGKQLKTLEVIKKGGGSAGYFDQTYSRVLQDYDRRISELDAQIKNGGKKPGGGVGTSQDVRWLRSRMDALRSMRDEYVRGAAALRDSVGAHAPTAVVDGGRGGGGGKGAALKGAGTTAEGGLKGVEGLGVESFRTTESMKELEAELSNFRRALAEATNGGEYLAATAGIAQTQRRMGVQGRALSMGVSTTEMLSFMDSASGGAGEMAEQLRQKIEAELKEHPIVVPVEMGGASKLPKIGEETMKAWEQAASAVASVGGALQGLEDPGAKVAGIIANAIATIALTFAKSLEGTWTPWDWIAGAAAGTATMIATIASIKSATAGSYAQGGIVPGNSYNGDRLTANVNSGELILNRSQQDAVAAQLEWARQDMRAEAGSSYGGGGNGRPWVSGEQIYLGLTNYLKRSGKGEIVTTR